MRFDKFCADLVSSEAFDQVEGEHQGRADVHLQPEDQVHWGFSEALGLHEEDA
jgi:hypothetical protein